MGNWFAIAVDQVPGKNTVMVAAQIWPGREVQPTEGELGQVIYSEEVKLPPVWIRILKKENQVELSRAVARAAEAAVNALYDQGEEVETGGPVGDI